MYLNSYYSMPFKELQGKNMCSKEMRNQKNKNSLHKFSIKNYYGINFL